MSCHSTSLQHRPPRTGSILFIVIALLLVLALLGAAYLKMSLSTRISSSQFVLDRSISTQLNGIGSAVTGVIADDLNDGWGNLCGNNVNSSQRFHQNYRGPFTPGASYSVGDIVSYSPESSPSNFPRFFQCIADVSAGGAAPTFSGGSANWQPTTHVPVISSQVQFWLADRIPVLDSSAAPAWQNISQSPATSSLPVSVLSLPFESPVGNSPAFPSVPAGGVYAGLEPTFAHAQNVTVPAFYFNRDHSTRIVAGDADGDGIADCLLSRVPGMTVDGLTWYVGIRIIDGNSAINANTACSRDVEFPIDSGSGSLPNNYCLFQTSVGLQELISDAKTGDSLKALFDYHLNNAGASPTPYDETGAVPPRLANGRNDFQFITQTDELHHQLIRRLDNPGPVSRTSAAQALSWSDSAAIASRFCLVDPHATRSANSLSLLETLLPQSTYIGSKSGGFPYFNSMPYGVRGTDADVAQWYLDNFNYDNSTVANANGATNAYGNVFPLRSLLTARNPVSISITPVYDATNSNANEPISEAMLPWSGAHFRGSWSKSATYTLNDIVLGDDGFTYIWTGSDPTVTNTKVAPSVANLLNATPPIVGQWQLQPWTPNPTKANINTATFRELFRDFWCVMAGNNSTTNITPFQAKADHGNIYDSSDSSQYMFRSPVRDCTSNVGTPFVTELDSNGTGINAMQLRAAIAAVNAMGLRNGSQDVVSRTILLTNVPVNPSPNQEQKPVPQTVQVRVYSSEPQPFITEVYANTYADAIDPNHEGVTNPKGYVAIELYNPYSVPLTLNNWQAGYIQRTAASYPNLSFSPTGQIQSLGPLITLDRNSQIPVTTVVIPPHGYALLENLKAGFSNLQGNSQLSAINLPNVNDAHYRPASMFPQEYSWQARKGVWPGPAPATVDNPTVVDVYVPGLSNVIADTPATGNSTGGEFILLRPRRADGTYTRSAPGIPQPTKDNPQTEYFDEGTLANPNLADLVPVDSYDFTGLEQTGAGASTYTVWSYIRPKGMPTGSDGSNFRSTYPGPYSMGVSITSPRALWTDWESGLPTDTPQLSVNWTKYPPGGSGADANNGAQPIFGKYFNGLFTGTTPVAGTLFPPIQIFNLAAATPGSTQGAHFPNPTVSQPNNVVSLTQNKFPFGTFARNGDMLEIPYIGSYRITLASQFASATPQFLELNSLPMDSAMAAFDENNTAIAPYENIGRFIPLTSNQAFTGDPTSFAWTKRLFDYFTVQSPTDAYLPNVDPALWDPTVPAHTYSTTPSNPGFVYPPATTTTGSVTPTRTKDATATNQLDQDDVGVEGLININTASVEVLSQLPLVSPPNPQLNQQLAAAIVQDRDRNGPFVTIEDLNRVINNGKGFQNQLGTLALSNISSQQGILTPPDPKFPEVTPITTQINQEEFQADNVTLTRISNLITTRSDTFTVYIVLQGWANAGSANAMPVLTRRSAFIVDRSGITADPRSRTPKLIPIPAE